MTSNPAAAIVVGIDGSPASLHALDWAAREAVGRHRPLRIVHAFQWPLTNELMGPPAVGPPDAGLQHAAERVLAAAADRARAAAPTLQVSTDLPADGPAAALIDASDDADLLVVGNRGLGGFTGLLLGSIGVQTAAHAACPVIVIRDNDGDDGHGHGRTGAGAAGQIVVGVDHSDPSSMAVDFAFAHAALHGMGVTAVHASPRAADAAPGGSRDAASDARHETLARMLAEMLAGYRDKYPDVPLQEKLVHGRPAAALVAESAGAALTVVGSRGRGGFTGLLLGSTSQSVLHHASSPVAIVRAHPARRGATSTNPTARAERSGSDAGDLTPVAAAEGSTAETGLTSTNPPATSTSTRRSPPSPAPAPCSTIKESQGPGRNATSPPPSATVRATSPPKTVPDPEAQMRHLGIVVGTDGSEAARTAVRWAAAEARLRAAPLKILTAYSWNGPPEAYGSRGELPDAITGKFEEIAAAAAVEARAWEPSIEVSAATVIGDPTATLLQANRTAAMLVVGNRGRGGFASLLLGSVSQRVATHGTGPVVVVRGRADAPSGPVVVGVDGSVSAQRALALGFDEAQRRGSGLLAVRSYQVSAPTYEMDIAPLPYDQDAAQRDAARDLDATLTPWRDKYPTVPVQTLAEPGSAAKNLVDVSGGATLLIVGSRGHGALVGSLLGSVGQQLLHHAGCPVMIVHPEQAT